ncbi:hypothetical protein CLOP_g4904 [Closterium sp. NIES-67]|nr:hypothetical protein CLOP_g4904 [Closterium sp. NIES-67]
MAADSSEDEYIPEEATAKSASAKKRKAPGTPRTTKKAARTTTASPVPVPPTDAPHGPLESPNTTVGSDGKTIEETYQRKTPLEHVLLRPDTYIGSVQTHVGPQWVWEQGRMVHREVRMVPGLYKIFDEILVNAADNKQRDPTMDAIKVTIDTAKNKIQVWNNGKGIPVEVHAKEGCYVPELIFGHLLTSSNYDDSARKTTGGRNGYGAKLANIFSTEFVVETADGSRQKKYKQVFSKNMSVKKVPVIKDCKPTDNFTSITFFPDLAKFGLSSLDADHVALMSRRVVDVAGCLGKSVKVSLNGTRVPVKSFADYAGLYLAPPPLPTPQPPATPPSSGEGESGEGGGEGAGAEGVSAAGAAAAAAAAVAAAATTAAAAAHPPHEKLPRIHERVNDNWEVCVSTSDGQFQQVSFVNAIATTRGGTHVNMVSEQIVRYLLDKAQKKAASGKHGSASGAAAIKPHQVRSQLWVFINCLVVNPAFDSQTKETLNTRPSDFGSKCHLSEDFLKKVAAKCGIVEHLLSLAAHKQSKDLKKSDGSKRQRVSGIVKLDDANEAGGRNAEHCTLILTEGDSAKTLAVSGLSVVGRDRYGVFPLRGKLLNVRDASHRQMMENSEIGHLKQILGLQHGKSYESVKALRYGHLMIMTDQDHDGSHIKGLLINLLHSCWPSLLKHLSFLITSLLTPTFFLSPPTHAHSTHQDHDGSHIKGLLINLLHSCWPSLLKHLSFLITSPLTPTFFLSPPTHAHSTHQDHDGSHIKGLLINLLHSCWPSLLKHLSFLITSPLTPTFFLSPPTHAHSTHQDHDGSHIKGLLINLLHSCWPTTTDHDGSHIKGLLINLLHSCWPSLLKHPSFLREFITPIVKATGPRGRTLSFYTIPEYEAWKRTLGSGARQWKVKYYKGLGTSTPKEAKEYFAQLDRHRKDFEWRGEGDGERIEMAFSRKAVDARKQWLRSYEPGTYLDQTAQRISYSDFVDKELILYSLADNMRSIPSVVDGMKPGQRKIMFACFKRNLHSDIKVAQLAGYVSEHAAYHHGEQSLMSTIVNLAQDFVGSNNVNLLVPSGQFGTRLQGGKDAASPRYIYTRLHRLTRVIFPLADDALLEYLDDDGQRIEPKWYVPILPMVLVNGSEGIGTGWSSYVPTFNPRDVVANLKRRMRGEAMLPMHPWFRGFKGSIQLTSARQGGGNSYTVTGVATRLAGGRKGEQQGVKGVTGVTVTELPIRTWTQTYKEFLEGLMGGGGGGGGEGGGKSVLIRDMREHHTDTSVHFELEFTAEGAAYFMGEGGAVGGRAGRGGAASSAAATAAAATAAAAAAAGGSAGVDAPQAHHEGEDSEEAARSPGNGDVGEGMARREREERRERAQRAVMEKRLKLTTTMNTGNMHLFDADGRMKKYDSPEQIIEDFFSIRLGHYERRKAHQLAQLRHELLRLDNRARFVMAVIRGEVVITNRKQADIVAQLKARGFTPLPKGHAAAPVVVADVDPGSNDVSTEEVDVEMEDAATPAGRNTGGGGARKGGAGASKNAPSAAAAAAGAAGASAAAFEYLLGMPLWSLTWERVAQLERERRGKEEEVVVLEATSPMQLWERDLDLFLETLEEVEAEAAEEERERERAANQHKARGRNAGRKGGKQQQAGGARGKKAGVAAGGGAAGGGGAGGRGKAKGEVGGGLGAQVSGLGDGEGQRGDKAQGIGARVGEGQGKQKAKQQTLLGTMWGKGKGLGGTAGGSGREAGTSSTAATAAAAADGTGAAGGGTGDSATAGVGVAATAGHDVARGGGPREGGAESRPGSDVSSEEEEEKREGEGVATDESEQMDEGEDGSGSGSEEEDDEDEEEDSEEDSDFEPTAKTRGKAAAPVDTPTPEQSTRRHSSRLTRAPAAAAATAAPTASATPAAGAAASSRAASPQQSNGQTDPQAEGDAEEDAEVAGEEGGTNSQAEDEEDDVNPSPPMPPPSPAAAAGMGESPSVIEMTSSDEEGGVGLGPGGGLRLGDPVSDGGNTSSNGTTSPSATSDPYSLHVSPSPSPPHSTPLHSSSTPNTRNPTTPNPTSIATPVPATPLPPRRTTRSAATTTPPTAASVVPPPEAAAAAATPPLATSARLSAASPPATAAPASSPALATAAAPAPTAAAARVQASLMDVLRGGGAPSAAGRGRGGGRGRGAGGRGRGRAGSEGRGRGRGGRGGRGGRSGGAVNADGGEAAGRGAPRVEVVDLED